jgi:hypothetical protein
VVDDVRKPEYLGFRLSPLLPAGGVAFTAHHEFTLREDGNATALDVRLRLTDSTVDSAAFIAGSEQGWNQALDTLAARVAASAATHPR